MKRLGEGDEIDGAEVGWEVLGSHVAPADVANVVVSGGCAAVVDHLGVGVDPDDVGDVGCEQKRERSRSAADINRSLVTVKSGLAGDPFSEPFRSRDGCRAPRARQRGRPTVCTASCRSRCPATRRQTQPTSRLCRDAARIAGGESIGGLLVLLSTVTVGIVIRGCRG